MNRYILFSSLILVLLYEGVYGQSFLIPIRVSDGVNEQILKIGIHPECTDGFDEGFDVYAPPPPPAGAFDARLTYNFEDYFIDIRDNSLNEKEFFIKYQPEGERKIVLYWDPDSLLQYGSFTISDPFTSEIYNQDMTQIDTLDISTIAILESNAKILVTPIASKIYNKEILNQQNKITLSNHPNPFNMETVIQYSIPEAGNVNITIYNALGQEVRYLLNEYRLPGNYSIKWDGTDQAGTRLSSGIYIYRVRACKHQAIKKMLFLK